MKKILLAIALLGCIEAAASPLDNIQIPSDPAMKTSLNGQWAFKFINGTDWSAYADFSKEGYDVSYWESIPVPGCWDALGILPAKYVNPEDVTGLYKTSFKVPASWNGDHVFLNFDGVLRGYELWVNGQKAGSWELANNSCQFDITQYVRTGENDLSMRVYTRYKGSDFDGNDDWGQVGIHRDVTLFAVPQTHLKDMKITSHVPDGSPAEVTFGFCLDAFGAKLGRSAVIKGEIRCPNNGLMDRFEYKVKDGTVKHVWTPEEAHLWTAETPTLYTLNLSIWQGGREVEKISRKFGIREIRIDGNKLLLNNRLFKLRGVTMHATDPKTGKVISEELNLKDMKMMKEGNVNFIRTSHYPREPRFYDLCDSLGFYVMDEVPFGFGDEHLTDSTYQDNLILRAQATIVRDKNHPSVIIWSIGNENPLTEICQVTGKYVQNLDPSRPICYPMIGDYFDSFNFELPDFLDIFSPHYPSSNRLEQYAQKSYKPLVATEYCHTLGQAFEEHHEMWEVMQANDNLAGGAIWEWVDQGMPDRASVWPGKFAWTDRVWISETDVIKMEGNQGTDGLIYPTRDPLPNYYGMRKNYAQAYVLSEKLGPDALLEVENRYDFVNLKDRVNCLWEVNTTSGESLGDGAFTLDCEPHAKCGVSLADAVSKASAYLESRVCVLTVRFVDKTNGLQVNEKNFVLNTPEQYSSIVNGLHEEAVRPLPVNSRPLWRSGRKPSLAEDMILRRRGGHYVEKYILKGETTKGGEYVFSNSEISYRGTLDISSEGAATNYSFDFKPEGEDHLLTEAGLALLLDGGIDHFQWLGSGPYTAYPGKDNANEPGLHALCTGDLYFEGNKRGVDALLCTDEAGNGVLFISTVKDVNLEQTDKGVLVSFNPIVSGIGRKGNITIFPNYSGNVKKIAGKVLAVPVEGGKWNQALKNVFIEPRQIERNSPFISVYDTYLRKLSDIVE